LIENNNELFVMNAPTMDAASAGFYFVNVPDDREIDIAPINIAPINIAPINIAPINIAPIYKLLFTETREYKIALDKLTVPTQKKIQAGKKDNILENYLIKLKKSLGLKPVAGPPVPVPVPAEVSAEVSSTPAAKKVGKMIL
jgi:hypothetical protein